MKVFTKLKDLQQELYTGSLSLITLVDNYLQKIEEKKHLNAFVEVFENEARERAKFLEKKENKGKLYGLVIGIKDNICYKDHKVSAASKMLKDFTSIYNATVVERLLEEDAIIIGRLNCDEFAMGGSNEKSFYGPVLNDVDNNRVSGGSSGGSAVAVQANLCHASLGSDTGGSVRQPASYCGVVGLKPTYGTVSRHGLIAFASSFDQIGPLTNSIEDAQLLLEVLNGSDKYDATTKKGKINSYQVHKPSKRKIAYLKQVVEMDGLHSEIKQSFKSLCLALEKKEHIVDEIDFLFLEYVIPCYYVLSMAEASSNLSRYDGIDFGYRSSKAKNLEEVYTLSRSEGFGKEVKNRILLGTFVLSTGYYDAYYAKAQKVRKLLQNEMKRIFESYEFIILPTTPTPAFKLNEKMKDPVSMYLEDIYTVMANLTGNPAISLPLFNTKQGLPVGLQVIAKSYDEANLFDFSKQLMSTIDEK